MNMSLDLEPKDAFVGAMAWCLMLVPDYVPVEHQTLASGAIAGIFWMAWQAFTHFTSEDS